MKVINVAAKEGSEDPDPVITLRVKGVDRDIQGLRSDLIISDYLDDELRDSTNGCAAFEFEKEEVGSFSALKFVVEFTKTEDFNWEQAQLNDDIEDIFCAADFLKLYQLMPFLYAYLSKGLKSHAAKPWEMNRREVLRYLRLMNILTRNERWFSWDWEKLIKATATIQYCSKGLVYQEGFKSCPEFYISYHFKAIMYERPLLELSYRSIHKLLSEDSLRISEEDVVRAIKIWINHDYNGRICHYAYLLRCVRFVPKMKLSFILEEILEYSDTAKDYVIAILALRNGYTEDISNGGPAKRDPRRFCECHR